MCLSALSNNSIIQPIQISALITTETSTLGKEKEKKQTRKFDNDKRKNKNIKENLENNPKEKEEIILKVSENKTTDTITILNNPAVPLDLDNVVDVQTHPNKTKKEKKKIKLSNVRIQIEELKKKVDYYKNIVNVDHLDVDLNIFFPKNKKNNQIKKKNGYHLNGSHHSFTDKLKFPILTCDVDSLISNELFCQLTDLLFSDLLLSRVCNIIFFLVYIYTEEKNANPPPPSPLGERKNECEKGQNMQSLLYSLIEWHKKSIDEEEDLLENESTETIKNRIEKNKLLFVNSFSILFQRCNECIIKMNHYRINLQEKIQSSLKYKIKTKNKSLLLLFLDNIYKNLYTLTDIFKRACLHFFVNETLVSELLTFHIQIKKILFIVSNTDNIAMKRKKKWRSLLSSQDWKLYHSCIFFINQNCNYRLEEKHLSSTFSLSCNCLFMYCSKHLYTKWISKYIDQLDYWCYQRDQFSILEMIYDMLIK